MATVYPINFTDPDSGSFNVSSFTSNGYDFPLSQVLNTTAVSAATSLLFFGRGHPRYGERVQENMVHLLENFSGPSEPKKPISGQQWFVRLTLIKTGSGYWKWNPDTSQWDSISVQEQASAPTIIDQGYWFDTANSIFYQGIDDGLHPLAPTWFERELEDVSGAIAGDPNAASYEPQQKMRVYDGVQWKDVNNVFTSDTAPQSPSEGDMWFDTTLLQLKVRFNSAWQESGGQYVNITGDTMTGVLQFGDPTGSLFLWEGGGAVATAPDMRATGSMLQTAADSFIIHFDDGNLGGAQQFEIAKGSQNRGGGFTTLLQVLNDGQIRASTNYETLGTLNPDNLINKQYVDDEITALDTDLQGQIDVNVAAISGNTSQIGTNTTNISLLAGGDFEAKVNRSGDTMSGLLTLSADPTLGLHAATKQYVDNEISAALISGGADGVLNAASYNSTSRNLQLDTTAPSTINVSLVHTHPANEVIVEAPSGHVFRDLLGTGPDYDIQNTEDQINQDLYQRTRYMEGPALREVFVIGGATNDISFTDMEYQVGTNQLDVYVNGTKQYASERAYQSIYTNSSFVLTQTSFTGLVADPTVYDLDINVDGGGIQTVSATGGALQTIQQVINEINSQTTGCVAIWDYISRSIRIYSNSQGNGSSIAITDGVANGLLAALAGVTPGTELPIYQLGNVFPPAGGAITSITQDLAYEETDSGFLTEEYGQRSSFISFNTALQMGDVVEVINKQMIYDQ